MGRLEKRKLSWESYRGARSIPGLTTSSVAKMILGDHSFAVPDFRKAKPEPDRIKKAPYHILLNIVQSDGSPGHSSVEWCKDSCFSITIGNREGSDYRVEGENVAKDQARIDMTESGCHITHLGSSHGTFVNGEKVHKRILREGNRITVGSVTFEVTIVKYRINAPTPDPSAHKYSIALGSLDRRGSILDTILQVFQFDEPVIKVGRLPSSHLRAVHDSVSRMHAVLEKTEGGWMVIDLGSTQGTRVNGERINKCLLKKGNTVKFGDVPYEILELNEAVPSASAPHVAAPPTMAEGSLQPLPSIPVAPPVEEECHLSVRAPINTSRFSIGLSEIKSDGSRFEDITVYGSERVIKVGKLMSSHAYIDHESVSRMHAVIEMNGSECVLIDLGSTRGTYINGEQIAKCVLKQGDKIKFGDVSFEVTQINY